MVDPGLFLRAIQADPHDDAPRLIYSDWLEEHGDSWAATYLRIEVQLAKLPLESPEASSLRHQLWQAWAAVDPKWLMIFTQPRMLRANPTLFPSAWQNFDLGTLREVEGTYDTWSYDSIPALPLEELRGEFQYLESHGSREGPDVTEDAAQYRQEFEKMVADAGRKGVRLPKAFLRFMGEPTLLRTIHSVTGCFFTFPDEYSPIRTNPSGAGMHVYFYRDSQAYPLWDLYVHPSGGHCVIARGPDYFDPNPPDPKDRPPYQGRQAWFVAPSFEAFVYRVWLENQIWHIEHADFLRSRGETPPPITPEIQAYVDHYRNQPLLSKGR